MRQIIHTFGGTNMVFVYLFRGHDETFFFRIIPDSPLTMSELAGFYSRFGVREHFEYEARQEQEDECMFLTKILPLLEVERGHGKSDLHETVTILLRVGMQMKQGESCNTELPVCALV